MADRPIRPRYFLPLVFALCGAHLAGCASMRSTPLQAYVWEMGHNCEHVNSSWQLDRVDAQGRYWIKGVNATSGADFEGCMREQYRRYPYKEWLAASQDITPTQAKPLEPARREITSGPATPSGAPVPVWNPGDEWRYRWESPQGKGTFVWAVDREELVDGTPFYVVKSGTTREAYYRKSDLALHVDKVNGQVVTRNTPPTVFLHWPYAAGARVDVTYTRERPVERQTEEMSLTCESSPLESVTVSAGTFEAVKVACRNGRTNAMSFEIWLSPAVKHMLRERTYFSYGVRERELTGLTLR